MKPSDFRLVVVESPFAGTGSNEEQRKHKASLYKRYVRACMADCLRRGEAPFASHALYTQPGVLDDNDAEERARGMNAGFAWRSAADFTVVYTDFGISPGMRLGIGDALEIGQRVVRRSLPNDALDAVVHPAGRAERTRDATVDAVWVPGDEW